MLFIKTVTGEQSDSEPVLQRVVALIRVRHYSRRTEEAYVEWVRRYIVFPGKRHPQTLGATDVAQVLSYLVSRSFVIDEGRIKLSIDNHTPRGMIRD